MRPVVQNEAGSRLDETRGPSAGLASDLEYDDTDAGASQPEAGRQTREAGADDDGRAFADARRAFHKTPPARRSFVATLRPRRQSNTS